MHQLGRQREGARRARRSGEGAARRARQRQLIGAGGGESSRPVSRDAAFRDSWFAGRPFPPARRAPRAAMRIARTPHAWKNRPEPASRGADPAPARPSPKKKPGAWRRAQIADKPSPSAGFLFFNGVMLKTPMPTQHELEM
ncbi:hypothetical protein, partial [Burkholderia pseudomallei]